MTKKQYIAARKQIERILQYLDDQLNVTVGETSIEELYAISHAAAIVSNARYELSLAMYDSLPIE
jgi:3-deoxy-D-arabino-heptulosonate 7-phosphate (DAHP) synthase